MYLNILKKDFKRKKTMNAIILIFVILSSMFVSGSVNNIIAVFGGIDSFFDKAEMPDYLMATRGKNSAICNNLDDIEEIDSYGIENVVYLASENILHDGKPLPELNGSSVIMSREDAKINYFDKNNNIIKNVKKGTVVVSAKTLDRNDLEVGDKITIAIGGYEHEFEIAGSLKDAFLGSDLMSMARFMVAEEDLSECFTDSDTANYIGALCYIKTENTDAVEQALGDINTVFTGSRDLIKNTYVMNMVIAGAVLIVSIILIITAFIVLRFTIGFTISEEFREIGVMKAIGIKNSRVRLLYIVKYLALSIIGAVVGFFLSIPFGKMLLNSATKSMVLENQNNVIVNFICSAAVVGIIVLFCYTCTRKVVKISPIVAIRNGQSGERYRKKALIHLGKSRLGTCSFLSVNDIFSSPKRFGIIVLIIFLCLTPVLIVANTANTLRSDNIVTLFGVLETDAYISDEGTMMSFFDENGSEKCSECLDEMEKTLAERGIPAKASCEVMMKLTASHGSKSCKSMVLKGVNTRTDMYEYQYGTPPQNENEVAMTSITAEKLNVRIGDTIKINFADGEKECIVTALYHSMNNMGEGIRLHESVDLDFSQLAGFMSFQVDFTDSPDKAEYNRRMDVLKDIYGDKKVLTASEFSANTTGMGDTLESLNFLILMLAAVVGMLVAILMERSFIERERGEISVMKAIGFRSRHVIFQHTLRMSITAAIAVIFAMIMAEPLTNLAVTPVFKMMGADYGINYEINKLEIFVIYPLIMFAVITLFTLVSALRIGRIRTNEVSNIE